MDTPRQPRLETEPTVFRAVFVLHGLPLLNPGGWLANPAEYYYLHPLLNSANNIGLFLMIESINLTK